MFDNTPTNVLDYPCIIHRNERVTHFCLDLRCSSNPYLCPICFNQNLNRSQHGTHQQSLVLLSELNRELSSKIECYRPELKRLYANSIGRKDYQSLLRKLQMGDRHYLTIEVQMRQLKAQIERQVELLQDEFMKRLQTSKMAVFAQLDAFHKMYVQNMDGFRAQVDPLVNFNTKLNISMKLLAEMKHGSADWYLNLKKTLLAVGKLVQEKSVVENINRSSSFINNMTSQLPFLRQHDSPQTRNLRIQHTINDYFSQLINIKELHTFSASSCADLYSPDSYKIPFLPNVLTPTSTTTSAISSARDLDRQRADTGYTSKTPNYEFDRNLGNRTVMEIERTNSNNSINRTVIKPAARYL